MKKKSFIVCSLPLASALLLASCSNKNTTSSTDTVKISSYSKGKVSSSLDKVDNSKWKYNASDKVYYQTGISYAGNPVSGAEQTLSIFVPADYMTATDNGNGTYTAKLNSKKKVGNYKANTAPIVIPINTPGYSAMSALTDYSSEVATYTKEGFIYVSAGLRGRDSGAPAGVTDAKAAIRYIRYNKNQVAGDTDRIFVFGMSGGGAQSAIIGASGDSSLYDDYLKKIGAVKGVSDSVAGVMAWCPITNLDTGNAAYEWNLGPSRSDLSSENQKISDALANSYASYINKIGLKDSDGNVLKLKKSKTGHYQAGSYYQYIKSTIEDSLNTFLKNTDFPYDASSTSQSGGMPSGGSAPSGEAPSGTAPSGEAPSDSTASSSTDNINRTTTSSSALSLTGTYNTVSDYIDALNEKSKWVNYNAKTKKATITSVSAFVKYLKSASKDLAAFDALDKSQGENELFGYGDGNGVHWDSNLGKIVKGTDYEASFKEDLSKKDSLGKSLTTRINMYTPLYYISDYYKGVNTSKVAEHWRIRTGIFQSDTALSTEVNLTLALKNYGIKNVDFKTVWGQGHTEAETSGQSSSNFIKWVNKRLK
ncbi:subtype A tannase [Streptococcus ferus]|uniref:subtype A tannase n=1 Tax=Streptococcus ferus TaxID=1345 RepID=UPI0035134159